MADESNEPGKVLARVILEIMGAPKEHVEATLKNYVENLKQDDTIKIVKEDISPAEKQKTLFSVFAELEIWFKDAQRLIDFCFDSMPSSVDIIKPSELSINTKALTDTLNDMQAKLHDTDMVVKTTNAKNKILEKNTKAIIRNFVCFMIEEEPKSLEFLSKKMGLPAQYLKPFLDELVKKEDISEKKGKYERSDRRAKEKD